jgi:hypothetical protein
LPSQRMSRRSSRDSNASYAVHRELEIKAQHHKNKTCVRDFLSNLYTDASNLRIMEDLQKRESELGNKDRQFTELQGKLGTMEKEMKLMKKQMAIKDKMVDEVRKGSKIDIDALLKVKINVGTDTSEMNVEVIISRLKKIVRWDQRHSRCQLEQKTCQLRKRMRKVARHQHKDES